ncbi:MAG: hypothetical protein PWP64_1490 [Candidatus Cloacimonadota bacterium]|nr:hypothetical protein [Candidatus Cloacimonadota bacterium]
MVFVLSALLALLLAAVFYHRTQPQLSPGRRRWLFALRSVTLFILLMILLSPILYFIREKSDPVQVLFLRDVSSSMKLSREGISKEELLQPAWQSLQEKYAAAGYKVLQSDFADGLEDGPGNSLLIKSLSELSQELDLSKLHTIVLASDGWFRDQDYQLIQKLGIPILALADSSSFQIPDLAINSVEANRYAYRNESALIRAKILATNYSGSAKINLYLDQKRVATQALDLEAGIERTVDFSYRFPQTGFYKYLVEVQPLEHEQRLGNNQMPGAIEVLNEKELIVCFADAPGWDNKFILDAIATNPRWQSKSYLIRNAKVWQGEQEARLQTSEQAAVIVIVNNGNLHLPNSAREYILQNLNRGAGLFYQGLPIPSLADHLPLLASNIATPYQGFVQISDDASLFAMLNPLMQEVSKLPPLDYYYVNPAPSAEILGYINNPQKSPAIAILQKPQQRCLSLSFLNLWRWQMQSPESAYQQMIVNILTWLSNKTLGAYSAIYKSSYLAGEKIRIRLRAEDDIRLSDLDKKPQISIFDQDGTEIIVDYMIREADEYSFETDLDTPGNYQFVIREPDTDEKTSGSFAVAEQAVEQQDFDFNLPLLAYLTSSSRGKLLFLQEAQEYQPLPATPITKIERKELALYKKWYIIALFILSFCLELYWRRRWGLL